MNTPLDRCACVFARDHLITLRAGYQDRNHSRRQTSTEPACDPVFVAELLPPVPDAYVVSWSLVLKPLSVRAFSDLCHERPIETRVPVRSLVSTLSWVEFVNSWSEPAITIMRLFSFSIGAAPAVTSAFLSIEIVDAQAPDCASSWGTGFALDVASVDIPPTTTNPPYEVSTAPDLADSDSGNSTEPVADLVRRADKKRDFFLQVMPLGASITRGLRLADGTGYREWIRWQLRSTRWKANMVGSEQDRVMVDRVGERGPSGLAHGRGLRKRLEGIKVDEAKPGASEYWNPLFLDRNECRKDNPDGAGQRIKLMIDDIFASVESVTVNTPDHLSRCSWKGGGGDSYYWQNFTTPKGLCGPVFNHEIGDKKLRHFESSSSITHARVSDTGIRDRIKFERIYGSGRLDYIYIKEKGWGVSIFDRDMRLADTDGDKRADVLCLEKNGNTTAWLNPSGGLMVNVGRVKYPEGWDLVNMRFADVEASGKADLIYLDKYTGAGGRLRGQRPSLSRQELVLLDQLRVRYSSIGRGENMYFTNQRGLGRADLVHVLPVTNRRQWQREWRREWRRQWQKEWRKERQRR
ncbi:hypothetical protein B0T26DRAFT_678393 [Lasiosphaeria miniovina]|uniref:Uncharacterized protein n=1 Tax=Lasiosphaeria miniovina TaxID=1954250 RepID=A0AA40AE38_9PEZI|nr:uncharacterized protein B0T26DRAFT_678393 [Lasiosphaeria miniovina]KAK0714151.1 hypothetical protein B0T26DRAFT_678393 [Lasiosphaeria miniovina]